MSRSRLAEIVILPARGLRRDSRSAGCFDPMVDGVAQGVHERLVEVLEDRAIELDLAAAHLELDLLARAVAPGRAPCGDSDR